MPLPTQVDYFDTPVQEVKVPEAQEAGVVLLIKREDLNHPYVSGNKWWKLKYNLQEAVDQGHHTLLTFGGAYSNHLYATAAAARELGLNAIGIIRGEEVLPLNPTLAFAQANGMKLHFISRARYRDNAEDGFIREMHDLFGDFYLMPEGGTNALAIKGVREWAHQIKNEVEFDYLCLPVGTGGTLAGLIAGLDGAGEVVGYSVLKNGGFLRATVQEMLNEVPQPFRNWRIETSYDHGGYAKTTPALHTFIRRMKDEFALPLDAVYTGKMMFGILDMLKAGKFKAGSTVLALHTGGLQGNYPNKSSNTSFSFPNPFI